jgi:uncharacterized coiled-coil protein SlyX
MKTQVSDMQSLQQRIQQLEEEVELQTATVKHHAAALVNSFMPSSLLKSAVNEITGSQTLKQNTVDAAISIGSGWLARKIFTYKSKNILKSVVGYGLQYITSAIVANKLPQLREQAGNLREHE